MADWMAAQLATAQSLLQILASLAVILLAFAAWRALRAQAGGNRVELDFDLQTLDFGGQELVAELTVMLRNVGPRAQEITNIIAEVRPSRHMPSGNGKTLPPTNLIISDDRPILLPPGLRHVVTTTFEVPREERLLRATAAISQDEWIDPDGLTTLGQKQFDQMGPSARWLTRLFDVSASGFRRF